MNNLRISGYGDDLTVNGIRIGDLTPKEHEKIQTFCNRNRFFRDQSKNEGVSLLTGGKDRKTYAEFVSEFRF